MTAPTLQRLTFQQQQRHAQWHQQQQEMWKAGIACYQAANAGAMTRLLLPLLLSHCRLCCHCLSYDLG